MNTITTYEIQGLIEQCPYKLQGNAEDQRIFEIVEENPALFVVGSASIFAIKNLENFWFNELYLNIIMKDRKEFSITEDFINLSCKAFYRYYHVVHPRLTNKHYLIDDDSLKKMIEFNLLLEELRYDWRFTIIPEVGFSEVSIIGEINFFIVNRVYPRFCKEFPNYIQDDSSLRLVEEIPHKVNYLKFIKSALLKVSNQSLSIEILVHILNTSTESFDIPKPINAQILGQELLKHPNYFKVSNTERISNFNMIKNDSVVQLLDFITPFYNKLIENSRSSKDLPIEEISKNSGLYVLVLSGNELPLSSSSEYTSIRPILFIGKTSQIAETFLSIYKAESYRGNPILKVLTAIYSLSVEQSISFPVSFTEILSKVIQNINFGFIELSGEESDELYEGILIKYSPIFNLENSGNIFAVSIKQLVENLEKGTNNDNI